ncbi:MAG: hypothetical protein Q8Q07_01830 [Dehalococcoidales bacterium]|nr:hypothetical protein [Dehalococcoidales bacterium]
MTRELSLLVNGTPVSLDYFVQGFMDHTIAGMMEALEGTGRIETLNIAISGDEVKIMLNNAPVPVNPFVSKIVKNTIAGMVSSLKGIGEPQTVKINITH